MVGEAMPTTLGRPQGCGILDFSYRNPRDPPRCRKPSYSGGRSCARRVSMRNMTDRITPTRFHESDGVEDWRVVGEGACAYFRTGSFAAGGGRRQAISELAGLRRHPPAHALRRDRVLVAPI